MLAYVFLLATALSAHAFDKADLREGVSMLRLQLQRVSQQRQTSCPAEYAHFPQNRPLKIALFYGYENAEEITADALHAAALTKILQQRCHGNLAACEFRVVNRQANFVQLEREISGQKVEIKIHSTSVTESDATNSNFGSQQWTQLAQSQQVEADFHRALRASDIVFYSGHSRYGAGFGFSIASWGQDSFNWIFKQKLRATLEVLRASPSRLKLFGMFSCRSNEHYRAAVQGANPNIDLIVTNDDISSLEGEQAQIGVLDSLLARRCSSSVKKSLVSDYLPTPGRIEYIRARR